MICINFSTFDSSAPPDSKDQDRQLSTYSFSLSWRTGRREQGSSSTTESTDTIVPVVAVGRRGVAAQATVLAAPPRRRTTTLSLPRPRAWDGRIPTPPEDQPAAFPGATCRATCNHRHQPSLRRNNAGGQQHRSQELSECE